MSRKALTIAGVVTAIAVVSIVLATIVRNGAKDNSPSPAPLSKES